MKKSGPVCMLCYERDHRQCHRQWIAEIIEDRDERERWRIWWRRRCRFTPHPSPASRSVPSIICTQPPPTCAETTVAALLAHPRQQQARPAHVDALADPQFQFAIAARVESASSAAAAAVALPVAGSSDRPLEPGWNMRACRSSGCSAAGTSRV